MSDPTKPIKIGNPDDPEWVNDLVDQQVEMAEAAEKAGAAETKSKARRLSKDELADDLWVCHALKHYDDAPKEPGTGHIHRDTAGRILGMLLQVKNPDLLRQMALVSTSPLMSTTRPVFAQIARIACKRRGIRFDVN